jgi:hypothetical protein
MGGSDEPENIVELTVEEHAEAHRKLYEQHGHWQDMIAWKGLLGLLTTDECAFIAITEGAKKGARITNSIRWTDHIPKKRKYPVGIDGRKIRSQRYWFNNGVSEGQFSLTEHPEGWNRGRLKSVMKKTNPHVSL